jgi:hypothetical protein
MPCLECEQLLQAYRALKKEHDDLVNSRDNAGESSEPLRLEALNQSLIECAEHCEWSRLAFRYHQERHLEEVKAQ